jgi:glycosyltransferase involved in cell wall biosynthesis
VNIVQAYSQFLPNYGGIEKHIFFVSRELEILSHRLRILTTNLVNFRTSTLPKTEEIDGITVSRRYAITARSITICPLALLKPRIPSECHILHIHSLNPNSLFVPLACHGLIKKLPVVVTPHFHPQRLQLESLKFKQYFKQIAVRLLKKADCVIALTSTEKQFYESKGFKNVYEIPNGVDLSCHEICEEKLSSFEKAHDYEKKKILFVGRMVESKNLEGIIKSLPYITKARSDILLYVVGSYTQHASKLEALARRLGCRKYVRFFFNVADSDLPYYYEASDLVVLPSEYEAFGLVILESWAHKKPIVVSNRGGMEDIVSQGGGIVMNTLDPKKWASIITNLVGDERRCKKLGLEGYELVLEKYTWKKVAKKLVEAYSDTLARRCSKVN